MRLLPMLLLGLFFVSQAEAQDARDYKASGERILKCVEAAEKALLETGVDIRRQCIGIETLNCDRTTEDNTYQSNKRMYCAGAEAEAWAAIMEKAYSQLLERYTKWDQEQSSARTGTEHKPVVPALKSAHEAWLQGSQDCEFAHIQAGEGTDRYDAPARCTRYQNAERALLYRKWVRGGTY
jgi:uncharacterized protein YecT (DUF1311 family)